MVYFLSKVWQIWVSSTDGVNKIMSGRDTVRESAKLSGGGYLCGSLLSELWLLLLELQEL